MIIKFNHVQMARCRSSPRRLLGRLGLITALASALGSGACATQMPAPRPGLTPPHRDGVAGTTVETLARRTHGVTSTTVTACHAAYTPDATRPPSGEDRGRDGRLVSRLDHRTSEDVSAT